MRNKSKVNSKKESYPVKSRLGQGGKVALHRVNKLKVLLEFGKKISSERSLDSLLVLLANEAKTILEADRCTIFILDKRKKILWSKVAHGTPNVITIPWNKGIAGECLMKGKMVNVKDAYQDARFNPEVDKISRYHTRSILSAPMHNIRGDVLGVFQVLNKKSGKFFKKEDEEILTMLAGQAGVAIENAQLYEQVRKATEDTIFRLAAAAEYKDRDTANHLIRMSKYSALIAKSLGYPSQYCANLELASPMHDIGKLGVPDAVLMKPGKLNDSEWAEMKKHPLYGAEILKDSESELLQMSQRVALCHHEKFDGSGYPAGLAGEEIPIEARIVALADVFDALTSKRVYKEKFSLEETLRIIREGRGKHFDPKVIDAFEKILPEIIEVMNKYQDPPEEIQKKLPKDSPAEGIAP